MSSHSTHAPYYGLPPLQDGTPNLSTEGLERTVSDLRMQLLSVSALLNSRRPINGLPPEILLIIFQNVRDLSPASEHDLRPSAPRWYCILGVCRYWRTLALNTPVLWTTLSVGPSVLPSTFNFLLDNSRQLPICVELLGSTLNTANLNQLAGNMARLKQLSLRKLSYKWSHLRVLSKFIEARTFPSLESFCVSFDTHDREESLTLSISPMRYPGLQTLALDGVDFAGSLTPIPTLVTLSLCNLFSSSITKDHLMEFLRGCSRLEELSLSCFRPRDAGLASDRPLQDLPALPPVHFPPSFRVLIIEDIDTFVGRLLTAFHLPPTADVNLGKVVNADDIDEFRAVGVLWRSPMHSCLPPDTSGLPLLKRADRLRIDTMSDHSELVAMAGQRMFSLVMANPDLTGRLDGYQLNPDPTATLITCFCDSPLTELRLLNVGHRRVSTGTWARALRPFVNLHTLIVLVSWASIPNGCSRRLLRALGAALDDGTMLCPQLSVLAVSCPEPLHDEASLLQLVCCLQLRRSRELSLTRLCLAMGGECISEEDLNAGRKREDFPPLDERKTFYRDGLVGLVGELQFWDNEWNDEDATKKVRDYVSSVCASLVLNCFQGLYRAPNLLTFKY